jgi:TRAP-type mannitol/chloroaromatic compound transport system substrate-binding protein
MLRQVSTLALLVVWLLVTGCAPKQTASAEAVEAAPQKTFQWKMVTTWPKNFPVLGTAPERFAKNVEAMSNGRLKVRVYGAGELVPAMEVFDTVSRGAAELGHGGAYYWKGKIPEAQFFTTVPFGFTAQEMNGWLHYGGGLELWRELYAKFGLEPLAAGNSGVQMGGWFNKEINSLDDYKGLKIRMPGLGGEVLRKLGAAAVSLPGGEIFPALQSGAIDATEWVGPWNDLAFGFYKVAKYYYYPGFHEPGTALSAGMNLKVWESLTPSQKQIVTGAAIADNSFTLAEFNARNNDALETLRNKHKVLVKKFSDPVLRAIGEASGQVVATAAAGDPTTKKVYDSFLEFRKKAIVWSKFSDQAFWDARLLPFKYRP